ncbi:MAG: AMP-binding protein [Candidatus Lokiarchaeota archaeon]|nr:AMP-binding protein [Candidatus Lokiarchaeota archaeon]
MIKEEFRVPEDRPFYHGDFWPEGVPHQLDYDYSMTLKDLMDQAVEKWPNDNLMWFLETWVTYKEFKDMVDSFATYLDSIGVKKGDVVAIHLPNCIQYVVAYYAITSIGAVATGVNPTYKPLEILHQVKLTGAKVLVALDALWFHFVQPFQDKWDFDKIIYTNLVDLASGMSGFVKFLGKLIKKIPKAKVEHPNAISFNEVLKTPPNVPEVEIDTENDIATLIMTGGTTGVPKAAALTHMNVVSNAIQCRDLLINQKEPGSDMQLGYKTGMVGVLPLYHSFAMTTVMNATFTIGGWMMLFPKPPETEELLQHFVDLPSPNGLIYCAAEILFQRIAKLPQEVIDSYEDLKGILKLCISGAGPLHEYVREPFEKKTGAKITEGYGLSEASPVVSANNFYGKREAGYIGVPAPGTDWYIFDQEDFSKGVISTLGEEGTGEICCSGPQVMKEYWKNPERTAATIKEWKGKKWLLTGDIGFMDEHGRIQIRDRKKQLIKMSGHSVFPKEVEQLIGSHEAVEEVAVAGVPDPKTGEAVKAWVALKPEAKGTITAEEIKKWAEDNMTRWKCPKYIDIIDEVPKSTVGKVMRRTLQEADPLWIEKYGKK